MDNPTPAERAAADAVSGWGQEHPTERRSDAEQVDPSRCSVPGPDGTRILHDEGHAWMYSNGPHSITIRSCMSCHRIDWDDVNRQVRRAQAKALRAFADANRFPSHWIIFRRDDGSGVTVGDLLREHAAGLEGRGDDR